MMLKEKLLCIFFPSRCVICDTVLNPGENICKDCEKLILHYPAEKSECKICGRAKEDCSCGKRLLFSTSTVPFVYAGKARQSVIRMKFSSRLELVKPFAEFISTALNERNITEYTDIITFIPMKSEEKSSRGYNQSELLAKEVGAITGLPVVPLLYKKNATLSQHSLGYLRRKGNILGAFEPSEEYIDKIKGKNILIIDDIITTGSTLNEAAKTLLIFGAQNIDVAAVAGVNKQKNAKRNQIEISKKGEQS